MQRLWNHPEGQARYVAETQRLLDEVWDEGWLHGGIDRMEALVADHVLDPALTADQVDAVRVFVTERRTVVQDLLDGPPPVRPPFDKPKVCLETIGAVTATFSTEWGTLEADGFAYDATLDLELYGADVALPTVGAVAGPDEFGTPLVVVYGIDGAFTDIEQLVLIPPPDLAAGTYPVDLGALPGSRPPRSPRRRCSWAAKWSSTPCPLAPETRSAAPSAPS